ncbi:MAG TPA: 16S rRNA (cytidine(1402)-2'-O)-methyltransferase [Gaiellales bacterium]
MSGALVVCPTPIGNLADVTLRVLDELRQAGVVACEDTRRTLALLDRHGIAAPRVSLTEHNEAARIPVLLERIRAGERVALVSDAGTPAVSDPGGRLVAAALDAGLAVEVLPGASAVTTAAVASGLAGVGFAFCGFLPRTPAGIGALLDRVDGAGLAVVAFESPRRLPATLRALADRDPGRRAAVCRELTKLHEEVRRGTLAELAGHYATAPKGEVTLVLAPAAPGGRAEPAEEALRELAEVVGSRRAAALASRLTGHPRNRLYAAITRARR